MVSAAFKYVPQTAATTFAFSSVWFFFYVSSPPDSLDQLKSCVQGEIFSKDEVAKYDSGGPTNLQGGKT